MSRTSLAAARGLPRGLPSSLALAVVAALLAPASAQDAPAAKEAAAPAEKVELRVRGKEGDAVRFRKSQTMDQDMGGVEAHSVQTVEQTYTFGKPRADGAFDLRAETGDIVMTMENPLFGEITIDTAKGDEDLDETGRMLHGVVSVLARQRYGVTLSPGATVTATQDKAEIVKKALEANPLVAVMGLSADDEAVKQTDQEVFLRLPEKAVAVGEKWTVTSTMLKPARLDLRFDMTLREFDAEKAAVDIALHTTLHMPDGQEVLGEGTGTASVSRADGLPLKQRYETKLTLQGPAGEIKQAVVVEVERVPVTAKKAETPKPQAPGDGKEPAKDAPAPPAKDPPAEPPKEPAQRGE
jgi:hypothetical protein